MKQLLLIATALCIATATQGQDKQPVAKKAAPKADLADMKQYIRTVQGNVSLYTHNLTNHSQEHDVNTIILDIEKYIDSIPKNKTYADQLLMKEFNPLRHFFLTTTNKTTVATSFLYDDNPYQFCTYNDTTLALYVYAIKDGSTYNLGKMTERKVVKSVIERCLLPALKALDEFTDNQIKYIGLSVYYGCKDTREGAPTGLAVPYCITLVASTYDLQQYAAGLTTIKGLLAASDLYLADEEDHDNLRKIQVVMD